MHNMSLTTIVYNYHSCWSVTRQFLSQRKVRSPEGLVLYPLPTALCNIIYSYKYLESDLIKHCHVIFIHLLGQPLIAWSHREDFVYMLPSKYRFIWAGNFRGEDLKNDPSETIIAYGGHVC
jgi:hypothetical protein